MDWWNGYNGRMERDAPLAERTWFKIGGPARWMVSPRSVDELCWLKRRATDNRLSSRVLGRGANILVSDRGFDGVVFRLDAPCFTRWRTTDVGVDAGGGVDLMQLSLSCARHGWAGLEPMAGIPGTLGGAIRMNAGGKYGEIARAVHNVAIVDNDGGFTQLGRESLGFAYRRSNIGSGTVVSARLSLEPADPGRALQRFHDIWSEKKRDQPLAAQSAGCIFKNPPGQTAGALIDRAGLKGASCGGAQVSERHANFIVAQPGTTGSDILRLIGLIRDRVRREHTVELELEIEIW